MHEAMARFRAAGWKTSLHSAGLPQALCRRDSFAELLPRLDVAFLNQPIARAILDLRGGVEALVTAFGEYLAGIAGRGMVVLTLDEHGAAVFDRDGTCQPADGTRHTGRGCDRCRRRLCGRVPGLLATRYQPIEAARRAVVAGSLAVTAEGAQGRLAPPQRSRHAGPPALTSRAMTIHVVGNCTIDLILTVERFPASGETLIASWDAP